jgi:hypothetical protein
MSERSLLFRAGPGKQHRSTSERDFTLLELLDRLLEGGVAIHGELTLAVADIDLVRVGLRLVAASVEALDPEADDRRNEMVEGER